jgi:hypothetical protein
LPCSVASSPARHRPPLFAEVDLISSHAPWTRIPRLISWDDVGDGSIFGRIPAAEATRASIFGDAKRARAAYGRSIEYSLSTLFSFVQRYGDNDLVLVVLGDHQPATLVSGHDARATTCRSRSSRTTRRCCAESPDGVQKECCPAASPGLADGRVPRPLYSRRSPVAPPREGRKDRPAFAGHCTARRSGGLRTGGSSGRRAFMTAG